MANQMIDLSQMGMMGNCCLLWTFPLRIICLFLQSHDHSLVAHISVLCVRTQAAAGGIHSMTLEVLAVLSAEAWVVKYFID